MSRLTDICPAALREILIAAYRADPNWCKWERVEGNAYRVFLAANTPDFLRKITPVAGDWLGLKAMSHWLANGPKVFRPSAAQQEALAHVDVNIGLLDYAQPYPSIFVEVTHPVFRGVLCYNEPGLLVCDMLSHDNQNDITTTVGVLEGLIEESLNKFSADAADVAAQATPVLRIACNSCLALANWGTRLEYLFPGEAARDKKFAAKGDARARARLKDAAQLITFEQEVKIHQTHGGGKSDAESGRTVSTHWRRGHWAMQAYGPARSLRKRILRPPVLVRSDLFVGDLSETTVAYAAN